MKKFLLVPALLGVMGIGAAVTLIPDSFTGSAKAQSTTTLTLEQIKQKALTEVNGTIRDIEYDQKGTKSYYEVDVIATDAEYELKYDAVTGELLQKNKDRLDNTTTTVNKNVAKTTAIQSQTKEQSKTEQKTQATTQPKKQATNTNQTQPVATVAVTQQQAINIALGKVNGTVTKAELDYEDNEYEIEIVKDQLEYDFDIDASTGAIIKMEEDYLD